MFDQFFRHQIFPITGQETTAAMLSFLLAEVGKHPDIEERLVYLGVHYIAARYKT